MSRSLPTVGPVERALHLRSLPLFHKLPPAELAVCAQLLDEVMVRRHTTLFGPQEGVPAVYLMVEGMVRIERGRGQVHVAESPEIVGLVEFLAGDHPIPRAVAATNVLALVIESTALLDLLEDHFPVFLQARRLIGAQLAQLKARLRDHEAVYTARAPEVDTGTFVRDPAGRLLPVHRLLLLQRAAVFEEGVGLGVLAGLIHDQCEIRLAPGETLWEAGSDAHFLCVVAEGRLACTAEGAPPFIIGPGGTAGAEAVFGDTPHAYSAVAEGEVLALRVDAQLLFDLAEDNFDLALRTLSYLSREILRLQDRIVAIEESR